jgi:hypothetical protein
VLSNFFSLLLLIFHASKTLSLSFSFIPILGVLLLIF